MNILLIFAWIYAAMISTSFWEAYVEGKHPWDENKLGWKLRFRGYTVITAYHFFLFVMMWPLLLSLPLVIYGFDTRLLGILISAYFSGLVIEDIFWFVANPFFKLKDWNSKNVKWYPWTRLGKLEFPAYYLASFLIALASWLFLWR